MRTHSEGRESHLLKALAQVCSALAACFGFVALLGWILALPILASFGPELIPMAPSTALLFGLLGPAIFFRARLPPGRAVRRMRIAVGCLCGLAALGLFVLSSQGVYLEVERLGFPTGETANGAPIGHMSPVTALSFALASLSFLVSPPSACLQPRRARAALGLAALVIAVNYVLILAYLIGPPLLYGGVFIPPALPTSLAFLLLGIALVALARTEVRPREECPEGASQRALYTPLLVFVVLALGIVSIVYLYYHKYETQYRVEVERQLSAIADLKASEIVQWRRERLGDGAVFSRNAAFSRLVRRLFENPQDAEAQELLLTWLRQVQESYQYDRVVLTDAQGVQRMAVPDTPEPAVRHLAQDVRDVLRSRHIAFLDFHRDAEDRPVRLGVLVPIFEAQDSDEALGDEALGDEALGDKALGVLVLRIDPETYLYPLINRWPVPSETAETLIVRRDGDDVLFLNNLRFQENAALALRFPLDSPNLPAAMAVQGATGIVEGVDYGSRPVLADVRPIPDSPWFMVARIDIAEVYAPLRERLVEMALLMGALLFGAGAGVLFLWRRQSVAFFRERLAAVEALHESEARYHQVLDNMMEGCQIIGFDWRYLYVNETAARYGRQEREALLGQTVMARYPGIEDTALFAVLRRCMEERTAEYIESEFTYPDASRAWFVFAIQPVPEGIFILTLDITERKQAEAALRRYAESLAAINRLDRVVTSSLDLDQVYDSFVQELTGMVPVDRTSIVMLDEAGAQWQVARQWTRYQPEIQAGEWRPVAGSVIEWLATHRAPLVEREVGEAGDWPETALLRKEGVRSRALLPFIVQGQVIGVLTVGSRQPAAYAEDELPILTAIADQLALAVQNARLFAQVQRHAAELEERVRDRTAQLEAANKELESFAYTVSHDLRAPLRAIDGFSRILIEEHGPQLHEEAQHYLQRVRENAQRMGDLIDHLLAFSRLGRQPVEKQWVEPGALAREVVDDLRAQDPTRDITVTVGALPRCRADPALLRQVFANLLENAFKFTATRAAAVVEVGAYVDGDAPDQHVYFVRDNGVGFDMQYADKIFGVFQRLHRAEDFGGTGVGLASVQRIVHRHGGRIWVEAKVNEGATFFFTLGERANT
ncbi:MAG: hypothetical protein Kow00120_08160 [Anaerolineae bacterium]